MNPTTNPSSSEGSHKHLFWFQRAEMRFGIPVDSMMEVTTIASLRSLPRSEPSLRGFTLFRDTIIPVFDPLSLAGLPTTRPTFPCKISVTAMNNLPLLAFVADRVGKMVEVSPHSMEGFTPRIRGAFSGTYADRDKNPMVAIDVNNLARVMGLVSRKLKKPPVVRRGGTKTTAA